MHSYHCIPCNSLSLYLAYCRQISFLMLQHFSTNLAAYSIIHSLLLSLVVQNARQAQLDSLLKDSQHQNQDISQVILLSEDSGEHTSKLIQIVGKISPLWILD